MAGEEGQNLELLSRQLRFHSPDGDSTLIVTIIPQEYPIPEKNQAFKSQMRDAILKAMREALQQRGVEILYGPKSETDDRFLLRIHERIKDGDATLDDVNLYRATGLVLVNVCTTTKADKPADIKDTHTVGEETCLSVVLGPADKKK